jgi:short-subunit dehydrogenase
VECWSADLAVSTDVDLLAERIREIPDPQFMINNAGFGTNQTFVDEDIAVQVRMIHVHAIATSRFCHAVLPAMLAARTGNIINVASISAMTRWPKTAVYCGSKLFVVGFTESLITELTGSGVAVQVLCPGQTQTNFFGTEEMKSWDPSRIPRSLWMTADDVAARSLSAIEKGSGLYIPGFRNRVFATLFGNRIIQRVLRVLRRWGITEFILAGIRLVAGPKNPAPTDPK